jgi:SepF-like predicted cell division protein (DUF552 family)
MQKQAFVSRLEEKGIEFKFAKMEKVEDVQKVKDEMRGDRILIINIAPILKKSMEQTECALQELHSYCLSEEFSLARMGQGRVLILPPYVRF